MDCDMENIAVYGVDTDTSPYDSGSYASSTTYLTGMAVVKTCETLRTRIVKEGAKILKMCTGRGGIRWKRCTLPGGPLPFCDPERSGQRSHVRQ